MSFLEEGRAVKEEEWTESTFHEGLLVQRFCGRMTLMSPTSAKDFCWNSSFNRQQTPEGRNIALFCLLSDVSFQCWTSCLYDVCCVCMLRRCGLVQLSEGSSLRNPILFIMIMEKGDLFCDLLNCRRRIITWRSTWARWKFGVTRVRWRCFEITLHARICKMNRLLWLLRFLYNDTFWCRNDNSNNNKWFTKHHN